MFDSEGWAMIYGGGFSAIDLYSRVNFLLCVSRREATCGGQEKERPSQPASALLLRLP